VGQAPGGCRPAGASYLTTYPPNLQGGSDGKTALQSQKPGDEESRGGELEPIPKRPLDRVSRAFDRVPGGPVTLGSLSFGGITAAAAALGAPQAFWIMLLVISAVLGVIAATRWWQERDGIEGTQQELSDESDFKDFAQRFAGWFKSHEIAAPPDMSGVLGEDYERELSDQVVSGELSPEEYLRRNRPLTERREWEVSVRSEYQRDWRAEVTRRFKWAKESGRMQDTADLLASLHVENPRSPEDFKELVAALERMAGQQASGQAGAVREMPSAQDAPIVPPVPPASLALLLRQEADHLSDLRGRLRSDPLGRAVIGPPPEYRVELDRAKQRIVALLKRDHEGLVHEFLAEIPPRWYEAVIGGGGHEADRLNHVMKVYSERLSRIIERLAEGMASQQGEPLPAEDGPFATLREHIEGGRSVETSERLDPQSGLPPVLDNDPLYEWALGAWRFLREYRYDEAARAFKGGGDASFERAFRVETQELGRDGYRNRCVRVLEDLHRELEHAQRIPLDRVALAGVIEAGTDLAAEAHLAGNAADRERRTRSADDLAAEEDRYLRREREWVQEAHDVLARHPDYLDRFGKASYIPSTGIWAVAQRVEAKVKVLVEIRDEQ
jgi:hypothetical protein